MTSERPGLVPVLGDARKHAAWGVLLPTKVPWLFQDVAQAGQVDIFLAACQRFLQPGGTGLLSLKAASERWTGKAKPPCLLRLNTRFVQQGMRWRKSSNSPATRTTTASSSFVRRRLEDA